MKWEELIPRLKAHPKVVVTGPHRSGTAIATRILAKELNFKLIPEGRFWNRAWEFLGGIASPSTNQSVIQAPLLSAYCHLGPGNYAVVFMMRSVEDILASERRIKWGDVGTGNEARELKKYFRDDGCIAEVKYEAWEKWQKPVLKERAYELEYESLSTHPLWVPKHLRKNFKPTQTEL